MNPLTSILLYQEMKEEREELLALGLSEEEVDEYFKFFIDSYVPIEDNQEVRYASSLRLSV